MHHVVSRHRQGGAVIVTVALTLLFLMGFMGIALDFGRLFIVKTELQTAMDSCALAAANELDGQSTALARATSAGMTAGNLNNVNLQSSTWNGQGKIVGADITFKDANYGVTSIAVSAKYAQCQHTQAGTKMWLLQALGAIAGDTATFPATQSVAALAVATRTSAQTSCMLPIGICDQPGGYQPGEWVQGIVDSREGLSGQFRWLDFSGNAGGANDVTSLLKGPGQCVLPGAYSVVRESGLMTAAILAYNTRFGIYNNLPPTLPRDGIPDRSGHAYYQNTVMQGAGAYPNKYPTFEAKQIKNDPYQGDNKSGCVPNIACDNPFLTGVESPGPGKIYSDLAGKSANRRVVSAPIVDCPIPNSGVPVKIKSVACIFLLHPVAIAGSGGSGASTTKMWIEHLGAASDPASPCSSFGLAGGTGGPLVPALVR